jgi:hypothetical protein
MDVRLNQAGNDPRFAGVNDLFTGRGGELRSRSRFNDAAGLRSVQAQSSGRKQSSFGIGHNERGTQDHFTPDPPERMVCSASARTAPQM